MKRDIRIVLLVAAVLVMALLSVVSIAGAADTARRIDAAGMAAEIGQWVLRRAPGPIILPPPRHRGAVDSEGIRSVKHHTNESMVAGGSVIRPGKPGPTTWPPPPTV